MSFRTGRCNFGKWKLENRIWLGKAVGWIWRDSGFNTEDSEKEHRVHREEHRQECLCHLSDLNHRSGMSLHIPENYNTNHDVVAQILRGAKTIAVVGLSSNPMRASHEVAEYLKNAGYRIIPVNPNETEVLGEKAYARLEDVPEPVDIVDVFRRAEDVPAVAESAIKIKAKVLWMQLGIENAEAAEKARAAGLVVVEDSCLMVEHKRRRS